MTRSAPNTEITWLTYGLRSSTVQLEAASVITPDSLQNAEVSPASLAMPSAQLSNPPDE